ncbi:hypothetical protein FJTKL_03102 [Diaporthe vaccinii]|uniref:Uncharacterized protein n=1 Tax=Diaporthe vaccinii TaxID=105482 RepID=A0ABR4DVZ7_9PEZI
MYCDLLNDQPAVWEYQRRGRRLKLCGLASEILTNRLKVDRDKLKVYEPKGFVIENQRGDPITGTVSSAISTFSGMARSTADIFVKPAQVHRMGSSPQLQHPGETHEAKSSKRNDFPGNHSLSGFPSKDDSTSDVASVNSHNSSKHKPHGRPNVALSMASASASGIGGFFKHYTKGVFIDMPLVFAEGSRALPKLYGEEMRDYGTVKDWKSGFSKSGKTLTFGIGEGFADLVVKPYKGVKEKGAVGGITRMGKGMLSFTTNVSSAAMGIVAYPSLGIYKSISSTFRDKTRLAIAQARHEEGRFHVQGLSDESPAVKTVLDQFSAFRSH